MEKQQKEIPFRMSKSELAEKYLPEEPVTKARKVQILKEWIDGDEKLKQALSSTKNYKNTLKFFSREQIKLLFEHLGEPCA